MTSQLKTSVNLTKVCFLVAEPNDLYRGLFRSLLFGFGAEKVFEAADIETADRMLARQKVDVLICAVDLGRGSAGIDYVRKIRLNANPPQPRHAHLDDHGHGTAHIGGRGTRQRRQFCALQADFATGAV